MTLWLSRARLLHDAPIASLREILLPAGASARTATAHRLVWALFSDSSERRRDFLWREVSAGEFILLSERRPEDPHRLFRMDEPKEFAPALAPGDRLRFALRANATKSAHSGKDVRGKPVDVVMNVLHKVEKGERSERRAQAVQEAGRQWLGRQGERAGFRFESEHACLVKAHRVLKIGRAGKHATLGVLDLEGELVVDDAARFSACVAAGFGRGKAFGNGLMLIRRA